MGAFNHIIKSNYQNVMKQIISLLIILWLFSTSLIAGEIKKWSKTDTAVTFSLPKGTLTIYPLTNNTVRVRFSKEGTHMSQSIILSEKVKTPTFTVKESKSEILIELKKLTVVVDRNTSVLKFKDAFGKIILSEKEGGRIIDNATVQGEATYTVEQKFASTADEFIYGTGQFQDGFLNIKGLTRRLTQVNTQIAIPFIVSNKGYGLLWHNYGLTDFNPADSKVDMSPVGASGEIITVEVTTSEGTKKEKRQYSGFSGTFNVEKKGRYAVLLDMGQKMARQYNLVIDNKEIINFNNYWLPPTTSTFVDLDAGKHTVLINGEKSDKPKLFYRLVEDETIFRSPVAEALDYVVFAGKADEVIASYRQLSGAAPMMPIWALGYIHCRERFKSQDEIVQNAAEFRNRRLPMDLMVQDWQYWGKYGWNAMRFDEKDYPDPAKMVEDLHKLNARLMVSVWSKIDGNSELGKEFTTRNYYIPNTEWVDFFNKEAATYYWKNFSAKLLIPYKIDAWWQDATEPENDDLAGRRINNGTQPGEVMRNVYPLFVTKTVYEGSRCDVPDKRVCILTRSAFSGEQRYASATWSGDIGNDWETLRRQITGGLNLMVTGLPWWTFDAGGFFRPGKGQYTDSLYHERFMRWFQVATFCPLQRVHGYQTDTEFWRFGEKLEGEALKYLDLRYRMLPYIYSQAAAITFDASTIMRPLVMDFSPDRKALEQKYEYMFGPSLLVAPVLAPGVKTWDVYLPENRAGWYDFWTGKKTIGGQIVKVNSPIEQIPLFVKAGSILPLGPKKQFTSEKVEDITELRIYNGADASFKLYEDDGVSYGYEKGEYTIIPIRWDNKRRELTIEARKGSFHGMIKEKVFNIVFVEEGKGVGINAEPKVMTLNYKGDRLNIAASTK
jgi:alpha-D-xyloside xylohydrolase